jgi:MoaA/NifB/PqqE/SkfB family radical SAM enzyme
MDLPLETYEQISRFFPLVKAVHLQGWGEPFLHRDLSRMIESAKGAGCSVGLTTNGTLLTQEFSVMLTELGVDLIAVSVAGATKETHEAIRKGSSLDRLVDNLKVLGIVKRRLDSEKPKVVLSFLMTRQNIQELPLIAELASKTGAEEIISTNLTCIPKAWHEAQKTFSLNSPDPAFIQYIKEAQDKAKQFGIALHSYPLVAEEALVCSENPLRNMYVSCDGYVAPCVHLNLPLKKKSSAIPRFFDGKQGAIRRTIFGNAMRDDILDIWNSESYRLFRRGYEKRNRLTEILSSFADHPSHALEGWDQLMRDNPLPQVCRTCYKAYGL